MFIFKHTVNLHLIHELINCDVNSFNKWLQQAYIFIDILIRQTLIQTRQVPKVGHTRSFITDSLDCSVKTVSYN